MSQTKRAWFRVNDLQMKVGTIIDGWYDGLLQVKEEPARYTLWLLTK